MKKKFNWSKFLKQVMVIAVPIALQNLLTTTGSMVDTMMVGTLGPDYVGAIGLAANFSGLMFSCYWGLVGGGILFISQYWGAQDDDGICSSYGLMLSLMMAVGLVFCVLGVFFTPNIMEIYTDKKDIQAIGIDYLRIVGIQYPISVLAVAASTLLRTTERIKIPVIASVSGVLTNVLFNYLLIGGHLGFPALGVRGAAVATIAASLVNLALLYILAAKEKNPYLFAFNRHFKWKKAMIGEFFHRCFPIICNEVAIGVSNLLISMVFGRQSNAAIAAVGVFAVIEGLFIGFFDGFSSSASILVGKRVGAGELEEARSYAIRICYLCGACILLVYSVFMIFHMPALSMMGLTGESLEIGHGMVLVFLPVIFIRMMNWTQNDTYRAAGDAAYGTILEIVFMYGLCLPLLFIAAYIWKLPFVAIYAIRFVDEPVRFIMMQYHMYNGKWVKPVTALGKAALPAFLERHRFPWQKKHFQVPEKEEDKM